MGVCASALYQCLVDDLRSVLTDSQIRFILDNPAAFVWPDASYEETAAYALLKSFYKKFVDTTSKDADAKALSIFEEVNSRCGHHNIQPASERMAELLGTFKRNVNEFFYPNQGQPVELWGNPGHRRSPFDYPLEQSWSGIQQGSVRGRTDSGRCSHQGTRYGLSDESSQFDDQRPTFIGWAPSQLVESFHQIAAFGSTGPGSSNGSRGTDFYTKLFDGPLGCTSSTLYLEYGNYVSQFPLWRDAENRRRDRYGDCAIIRGSKLYFVPKNHSVSRTICSEPVLNMFFQLGLGRIIERRLRQSFGIDLSVQPFKNRELARKGSLDSSFCTIDLSSASDSLGLRMLSEVIPRNQLAWFLLLRSPVTELQNGRELVLNMLSTMGNGYTFPLQTMLFSCAVLAAYEWRGIKPQNPYGKSLGNWSVFGDDIIVLKEAFRDVVDLLELLGFRVNSEKTFSEGWFRESCGADFLNGRPVRGVYIKSLRTAQDRYVAINRLNQWSSDTGITLPRTVGLLARSVRFLPIPYEENDDAGIKVPSSLVAPKRFCPFTGSLLYERSVARPSKLRIKDLEIRTPKGVRKRLYNAEGLLLSFLRGDVKGSTISIRHGAGKYSTKRSVCPNWDYRKIDNPRVTSRDSSRAPVVSPFDTWRRWESAASENLFSDV